MPDITGLIGSSGPSGLDPSAYGLDPQMLAAIQAHAQYMQGVSDGASSAPAPQAPAAATPGSAPQLKPSVLDYASALLFQHKSPLELNAEVNAANLGAQQRAMSMSILPRFYNALGSAYGQGAPQAAPAQSPAAQAPAPLQNILPSQASQAPAASPPAGGAGVASGFPQQQAPVAPTAPTMARLAPILAMGAVAGIPGISDLERIAVDSQPEIAIAPDGSAYNKKDPGTVGRRFAQAPTDGVDFGIGSDGKEVASLIPGYVGAMGQVTAGKTLATNGMELAKQGYVPTPQGWVLPALTRQTLNQSTADSKGIEANATKSAEATYAGQIAKAQEDAKAAAAGATSYNTKTGGANADRLTQARTDLESLEQQRAALVGLKQASDQAGTGSLNMASTNLARAYQTITGQSLPKVAAQQVFSALAPSLYQGLPGLQIRNEREFNLATSRVPTLNQDPQARARAINFALQVNAQKAREAKIIQNFAAKSAAGLNGTVGVMNGRPATVDDYIAESRNRNPLVY